MRMRKRNIFSFLLRLRNANDGTMPCLLLYNHTRMSKLDDARARNLVTRLDYRIGSSNLKDSLTVLTVLDGE
jgi:hypothetical protein